MTDAALGAVAGFTSTGSKRPEALFGTPEPDLPRTMARSSLNQLATRLFSTLSTTRPSSASRTGEPFW